MTICSPPNIILIKVKVTRNKKIIYLRDNESKPDFGYEETIAILMVATGNLGFKPKLE